MHLARAAEDIQKTHLEILKIQQLLHNDVKEQCIQQQQLTFVHDLSCVVMTGKREVILRGGETASRWGRVSCLKSVLSLNIQLANKYYHLAQMLEHHFDLLKTVQRDTLHTQMNSHLSSMVKHCHSTSKLTLIWHIPN